MRETFLAESTMAPRARVTRARERARVDDPDAVQVREREQQRLSRSVIDVLPRAILDPYHDLGAAAMRAW